MMGGFSVFPPVLKILLIVNVAVFIFQNFILSAFWIGNVNLLEWFREYFYMWPVASGLFYPWQIFTYMFIHGGLMHLFLNMFVLWMFGMELENTWGSKKFLLYYFMCGVGAGLTNQFIAPFLTSVGPTVGASGAIYGVLAAFAYLFPNRPIYIYFLFPVKAKYVIIFYMAIDLMNILSGTDSNIAHVAHLGGAVVGLIYLISTNAKKKLLFRDYDDSDSSWSGRMFKRRNTWGPQNNSPSGFDKKINVPQSSYEEIEPEPTHNYESEIKAREQKAQERIDAILDKLSTGGYENLTEEEKRILFQESKKLR